MEQLSRPFWRAFWKGPRSGALSGALLGEGPLSGALLLAFIKIFLGPGKKSHFWSLFFRLSNNKAKNKRPKVRLFTAPPKQKEKKVTKVRLLTWRRQQATKVRHLTRRQKRPLSSTNPTRPLQLPVLLVLFWLHFVFFFAFLVALCFACAFLVALFFAFLVALCFACFFLLFCKFVDFEIFKNKATSGGHNRSP